MTSKTVVRELAQDLRRMNPGYKVVPIGDIIAIDRGQLLDLVWPEGWSFNGYDTAFVPGTGKEVFILGGFNAE